MSLVEATDTDACDIIDQIERMALGMVGPAFRGQADASWPLRSGAVHRLVETHGESVLSDEGYLKQLLSGYHRDISRRAEIIEGAQMTPLQRLSVLQHFGAGTGLLDFTRSALVALWFACDGEPHSDGRVFALDIANPLVAVDGRGLDSEGLFDTGQAVYYEPDRSLGARIVAQQSVFVICNPPPILDQHVPYVDVPAQSKMPIQERLERLGLSRESLFCDLPGLARANSRTRPLLMDWLTPEEHLRLGTHAYRMQRYADALASYESYASAYPDVAQSHCLIGDAYSAMGRFDEASTAYTRAIENIDRPMPQLEGSTPTQEFKDWMLRPIYYNRGNAHAAVGRHSEAIADFDRSLALEKSSALDSGDGRNVLFNRGNSKYARGRFQEASRDFEEAWSLRETSDAALALGNTKMHLGEFAEALIRYHDGANLEKPESADAPCRTNAKQCSDLLEALAGHDFAVRPSERSDVIVTVEAPLSGPGGFVFVGNRGNVGNTPSGMVGAPGGEGYGGMAGFAVLLRPAQGQAAGR
ncbi:MAG: tetratricopeptide repeat protein [Acidimicrobiia bacterium]|nr:tetratricopeptide repeat protein [Acidimicrobiia bacterium]